MPESFGVRLRRQRERQQVGLASIAEQTKIHLPLLEELEQDNVSHWPSGIFRRAFVRAYAHAIGLEPDDVVREFLVVHPDPREVVTIGTAYADDAGSGRRPPTRLRYVAGAAVDSLIRRWRALFAEDRVAIEESVVRGSEVRTAASFDPDLLAAAHLCTKFAGADVASDVTLLLRDAVRILDAIGLIVWAWDPLEAELKPAMAEGYSSSVLSQLPKVRRDADNATAAAFRSAKTCAVEGVGQSTSALAVPVMSPEGCVGVLAVELTKGREQALPIRAVVTMFAAQMGRLLAPPASPVELPELRRA